MDKINEGGCLCGSVRYRVKGDPLLAAACHCKLCQLRTGSAFSIAVYFGAEQIEFASGSLKPYRFRSDESDRWVQTEFCENCGTTVTWTSEFQSGRRAISGGTFDDPNWIRIDRHVWTRSAHRWMVYPSDVATFLTTSLK
jgi:hypothetical protein